MNDLLTQALTENQITLSDASKQKLIRYLQLIDQWNRVFNLTSIVHPRDRIYLHIIDSLLVQPFLQGQRMLDVGSGAGLPGIPLAIAYPDSGWTLLDKNNKKTRFLTQVVAELGLPHVNVMHGRCEDFHPPACFDTILSRAFGTLRMFVETTGHLLCQNGKLVAMKGKHPTAELNDVPADFTVQNVTRLTLKGINVERHLVVLGR